MVSFRRAWLSRLGCALALAACASMAPAETGKPDVRTINITVYGEDACPKSTEDEIVVCAHRPESERYRIPKELRKTNDQPTESAWGTRSAGLDEASSYTRPNSCSVVGSYGQTGCFASMLHQWFLERQAIKSSLP